MYKTLGPVNRSDTHSIFYIAILCPEKINERVEMMKQWMKKEFGCIVAMKSPAHITIVPPFWMANEKQEELIKVFESFRSAIDEVEINLSGFGHFQKNVLFVNVKENSLLTELKTEAENYFSRHFEGEIKKEARAFHPHVTIATRDVKPSAFARAWDYFSKLELEESFTASAISLMKLESGKWNLLSKMDWKRRD